MPISLIFPAVLLLWITSGMYGMLRDHSGPYDKYLIAGGLAIIGTLGLIIWHDLRFIVHSWALFD